MTEAEALSLGQIIEKRRTELDLSVRKAAGIAGISEGLWRQIEKGYRQVTADVRVEVHASGKSIRGIARALSLDPVPLLEMAGLVPTDADRAAPAADNAVIEAILADPTLLPEARAHFLNQYHLLRRIHPQPSPSEIEARAELDRIGREELKRARREKPPA